MYDINKPERKIRMYIMVNWYLILCFTFVPGVLFASSKETLMPNADEKKSLSSSMRRSLSSENTPKHEQKCEKKSSQPNLKHKYVVVESKNRQRSMSEPRTPCNSSKRSPESRKKSLPIIDSRPVILVIDDDKKLTWNLFPRYLERCGKQVSDFNIIFVSDGEEGARAFLTHMPILTFIDFELGSESIDGKQVVKRIEELCSESFVKINIGHLVAFSSDEQSNISMKTEFRIPKLKSFERFKEIIDKLLPEM